MNRTDSTIMWILFWFAILTVGDPDLLDKIMGLLDALIAYFGGTHA